MSVPKSILLDEMHLCGHVVRQCYLGISRADQEAILAASAGRVCNQCDWNARYGHMTPEQRREAIFPRRMWANWERDR